MLNNTNDRKKFTTGNARIPQSVFTLNINQSDSTFILGSD